MAPRAALRNQNVTYWTTNGLGSDGFPAFNAPVTVRGRWEDKTILVRQESGGEMISSNTRVYLGIKLSQGDFVYEGTSVSATPPADARKVVRVNVTPSISARSSERVHFLD